MISISVLGKIARLQWQQICRVKQLKLMLVCLPLLLSVLICFIYSRGYLRDMPTVLVDLDGSRTSHQVARYLDAHRFLQIRELTYSLPEGHAALQARRCEALILIPAHFEKNLKCGRQTTIKAYSYGSYLVAGRELQKAVSEITLLLNARINLSHKATTSGSWENLKQDFPPLRLETHSLYNPYFNYQWFVPPGIIIAIWQLLLVLSVAVIWSLNFEQGEWEDWLNLAERRIGLLWLGRLLPFIFLMSVQWLLLLYVVFPLFGIPVRGPLLTGFAAWLLFLILVYQYGSTVSVLSRDSLFSVMVCSLTLAGAFAFSGYSYPFWEIPLLPRMFAVIMPTTHYLPLFQSFYLQNSSSAGSLNHYLQFLLYAFILFMVTLPVWLHQAKKAQRR